MPLSVEHTSKRYHLHISGIVQGVGFRPYIYQLAQRYKLHGFVRNDGDGVHIEIEADEVKLEDFFDALEKELPPLARVDSIQKQVIPLSGSLGFRIVDSKNSSHTTMLPADVALCSACEAEMNDPENRRYKYPFINCTDCGPRYSIIQTLPYDRPNTTMAPFVMCPTCQKEYDDPMNRRYHAQPISCYECGPSLLMLDLKGNHVAEGDEAIAKISQLIKDGKSVAIKGVGGFHIVCDATNEAAVNTLRLNKRRVSKPLAVLFKDLSVLKKELLVSEVESTLLTSIQRPIVLLKKTIQMTLAPSVAPGIDKVGAFLAYTPLHQLLLEKLQRPIVATSANMSDTPILTDAKEVLAKLSHLVYAVLDYDRKIEHACDDSVKMLANNHLLSMRVARGYAPLSFSLKKRVKQAILAVGANQKNTIALAFDKHMVVSPHIGDLVGIEAVDNFKQTIADYQQFYDIKPKVIVCDKHPGYESHKWAKALSSAGSNIELIELQHHYAHTLSCMAEYELDEKVLAFCFDGTGYGDDGTLWGGEVLLADSQNYQRLHHLQTFRLIGGEKAVKEPKRVALAILFELYTIEEIMMMDNPACLAFDEAQIRTMHKMYEREINAPLSSSIGRLFDAVASLSGIVQTLSYEGESGLMLEQQANRHRDESYYPFALEGEVISFKSLIAEILQEKDPKLIAARFMNTLTRMIIEIAQRYPEFPVILSGGVFQNQYLLERVISALNTHEIRYYIPSVTAINDGGIALGQLYYALHKKKEKNE